MECARLRQRSLAGFSQRRGLKRFDAAALNPRRAANLHSAVHVVHAERWIDLAANCVAARSAARHRGHAADVEDDRRRGGDLVDHCDPRPDRVAFHLVAVRRAGADWTDAARSARNFGLDHVVRLVHGSRLDHPGRQACADRADRVGPDRDAPHSDHRPVVPGEGRCPHPRAHTSCGIRWNCRRGRERHPGAADGPAHKACRHDVVRLVRSGAVGRSPADPTGGGQSGADQSGADQTGVDQSWDRSDDRDSRRQVRVPGGRGCRTQAVDRRDHHRAGHAKDRVGPPGLRHVARLVDHRAEHLDSRVPGQTDDRPDLRVADDPHAHGRSGAVHGLHRPSNR